MSVLCFLISRKVFMDKKKILYVSDLDGTLLGKNAQISSSSVQVLNKLIAEGMNFSAATGRSKETAMKVLEVLDLKIPVILLNGVLVYDMAEKKYINAESMKPGTAAACIEILRKYGLFGFIYRMDGEEVSVSYESAESEANREYYEVRSRNYSNPFIKVSRMEDACAENTISITLRAREEELRPAYEKIRLLPGTECVLCRDDYSDKYFFLECFSSDAAKGNGVRFLKRTFGFEYAVGFGDNLNDLSLFSACDEKYAVENAEREVREAADAVIKSSTENGVAEWLYENF